MAQSGSYLQMKGDVLHFLRNQSVDGRIQAMVLDLVNQALRSHPILLSNQEKDTLTQDVMKVILLEMLNEFQNASNHN